MIGIMEENKIKSMKKIADFTDDTHEGYGLETTRAGSLWHDIDKTDDGIQARIRKYIKQFEFASRPLIITMELDMTQKEGDHGKLKYIVHNETKKGIEMIRTDGEYTNIAFDIIDVDKKYRFAFGISQLATNKWA